jgi:glyoxylase-like metal-dependent hydrolase (beta-lactamase superfamily II)
MLTQAQLPSLELARSLLLNGVADATLEPRVVAPGVTQLRLSNRLTRLQGMIATPYLVGDLLVDAGFSRAGDPLLRHLAGRELEAICCTHHHEDHVGNCGPLARAHGCPVYLRDPGAGGEEGVEGMLPYRWLTWGPPCPYEAEPLPPRITGSAGRTLRVIPTPGHSRTHVAFFEERSGLLFSGDIYISGGAAAVMSHENPYQSICSLRRVAELEPSRMLTGHGLVLEAPAAHLRAKADRIEAAAERAVELHARGVGTAEAARRIFGGERTKDRWMTFMTRGEFSRHNFVRASVEHLGADLDVADPGASI